MKWLSGAVAVFLVMAVTATGFAYGPHDGKWRHGGCGPCGQEWGKAGGGDGLMPGLRHQGRMARILDLTKEQMDKIAELQKKYVDQVKSLREDLFRKRVEARNLFADPKADEGAIVAKEKEMNATREKLHDSLVQFRLEQRKVLTPEQLKKLAEFKPGSDGWGRGRRCG